MAVLSKTRELRESESGIESGIESEPVSRTFADIKDLFRKHAPFVARSLRRLGIADSDVEDALQEVFLVASRRRGAIKPGSERGFLYGTSMRVAQNTKRSVKRRRSDEPLNDEIDAHPGPTSEELVDRRAARAALDVVLDGMTVEMRAVFTLYTLEEMTTNEIAALLGVPPGTVSSRLRRAREYFDEEVYRLQLRFEGREP